MIVKSVMLPLAPTKAFELFTKRGNDWWPPERRHTADRNSRIFLLESGRFYERASDGREVELGKVRSWDYPNRLLLDFYVATGPEKPTEVEIAFAAQPGGTRVTVLHRPKPESNDLWCDTAPRYAQSWDVVLNALLQGAT